MTAKPITRPWTSGFCAPSNPVDTHARCPEAFYFRAGPCPCHTPVERDPQLWDGDQA